MSKVLLIYAPYYVELKCPPVGLLYLASYLRENGMDDVEIIDMGVEEMELSQLESEIRTRDPMIIGISFMTPQVASAIEIANLSKKVKPSVSIVVGGPHATCLPAEVLKEPSIDYVVMGEGEATFSELAKCILEGKKVNEVNGIAFCDRETDETIINEKRSYIKNLDTIPFPAWDLVPILKYKYGSSFMYTNKPVLAIIASRGCPGHCIFCDSHTIFGRRFRMRSAENIFAEMEYLYEKYGIDQFDFSDDTLTIDRNRLFKLCDLIEKSRLPIHWTCNSRVDRADLAIFKKMKEAGCLRVDFGVESGDPVIIKRIRKGITIDQVMEAHRTARKAGLKVTSFFMVGLPGQDLASIEKSLTLIRRLETDNVNYSIATPFPGTALYQEAKEKNWLRITEWEKFTTSPAYKEYIPVMITDEMTQDEILEARKHSVLTSKRIRFTKKYGNKYYLNPRLYIDNFRYVFFKEGKLNLQAVLGRLKVAITLIRSELAKRGA